ncbi:unnamed protein product [Clavelina lepadiformis]|uniref:Vesicle-fusing ATPase n=1 Tax=Clavelina lepadiformis TaxID=159417 RepID=A0ABP0FR88_CLALP
MTEFPETSFKIIQCPIEENLNMTNCAILHECDISKFFCLKSGYIEVKNNQDKSYIFTTSSHSSIEPGSIGLSQLQMDSAGLKTGHQVVVDQFRSEKALAQEVSFEIGISTPATASKNCFFTNSIKDVISEEFEKHNLMLMETQQMTQKGKKIKEIQTLSTLTLTLKILVSEVWMKKLERFLGMTNRRDMIDEALLRPGRLDVHLEIGLPDEDGRLQILSIHSQKMKESQMLSDDVDLGKIASLTENFTGAELAGLVGAAQSRALVRHKDQLQARNDVEADHKILVCHQDFMESLENDIKPAFGFQRENLKYFMSHGIIEWNNRITRILEKSAVICDQVRSTNKTPLVSVLITGGVGSGKTALATKIADDSRFPFIRVCTPDNLIGFSEAEKCQYLKKVGI